MKRVKVLFGQRRFQVLLTLAVLVLVVGGVLASGANFTATSANPGNMFTAGSLTIGNYKSDGTTNNEGQAIASLTAANMKPGDSTSGTAVIKNTGSIAGTFTLSGTMNASAGTYLAAFASDLQLTVVEDGATTLVNGVPLTSALTTPISLGSWNSGVSHTFLFTVKFPNGTSANDNPFMGKSATIDIAWNAVQS